MGEVTRIQWCHHTFSPWWGCTRESEGCAHCYALDKTHRFAKDGYRYFGDKHWNEPLKWNRKAEREGVRRRVFPSMCDPFEDREEVVPHRTRLWGLIDQTPHLDWLLLTKRPQNMMSMRPSRWANRFPDNVWLGVTAENQKRADERIPLLLRTPAVLRFVSCEPLLESIRFQRKHLGQGSDCPECGFMVGVGEDGCCTSCGADVMFYGVDWLIAGAESGHKRRPMKEDWVRELRDQAVAARVPFFYKQRAESKRMVSMPFLGGRQWAEVPSVN
jgi:protein gp37